MARLPQVKVGNYWITVTNGSGEDLRLTAMSIVKEGDVIYRNNLPEIEKLLFDRLPLGRYELQLAQRVTGAGEDSIAVTVRYRPEVRRKITRTLGLYIPVPAREIIGALQRTK